MKYQARAMAGRPKWPRSAYSASPPVTHRNTAPKTASAMPGCSMTKATAWIGFTAASTSGERATDSAPSDASTANQSSMIGPKARPMRSVPLRWIWNSATRMTRVMGTTEPPSPGAASSSPSTALSTEMAGVMTPSPKNSAQPTSPISASGTAARAPAESRASCMSASTPPSPSLSARSTMVTYLSATTLAIDQNTSESTPRMLASSAGDSPETVKTARKA